jgi:hypothetical protein
MTPPAAIPGTDMNYIHAHLVNVIHPIANQLGFPVKFSCFAEGMIFVSFSSSANW